MEIEIYTFLFEQTKQNIGLFLPIGLTLSGAILVLAWKNPRAYGRLIGSAIWYGGLFLVVQFCILVKIHFETSTMEKYIFDLVQSDVPLDLWEKERLAEYIYAVRQDLDVIVYSYGVVALVIFVLAWGYDLFIKEEKARIGLLPVHGMGDATEAPCLTQHQR